MFAKDGPLSTDVQLALSIEQEFILNFLRKLIKLELIVKANDPDRGDNAIGHVRLTHNAPEYIWCKVHISRGSRT